MTKHDHLLATIARRNLALERFGRGWRIYGHDCDILVANLHMVDTDDLCPAHCRRKNSDRRAVP